MGQNGLQMGQNRKNCVSDETNWFADGTKQKNGLSDRKKWLTDGTK